MAKRNVLGQNFWIQKMTPGDPDKFDVENTFHSKIRLNN